MNNQKKQKTALILSGGAALGAAHVGALRILEQHCEFDFLAGVSAGAIISAGVACGKTAAEMSELIHSQKIFRLLFDSTPNQFGFSSGKKVLELLRQTFDDRSFSDLENGVKLFIGATNFQTGEAVVLDSGSIAEAVRASLSIPGVFAPFFHQDKWLVDGFLSKNFPIDVAIDRYKGNHILGIDTASTFDTDVDFTEKKFLGTWRNARGIGDRVMRILMKNQQPKIRDPRVKIIRPNLGKFTTTDINHLEEIEKKGESAAEEFISR